MSAIIRPGKVAKDNQISFLWQPGSVLVEMVYDAEEDKLRFVSNGDTIDSLETKNNGITAIYKPLEWLREGARRRAVGFPAAVVPAEQLDLLIEKVKAFIHRYFDCDVQFEHVAAAYALMTWVYEAFDALPYLRFLGEPESGKSTASLVVGAACYRSFGSGGAQTSAPIFRMIEAVGGTMVMDEADFRDSQIGSDITKILNTGYRKGFSVQRCSEDNSRVEFFDAFGPKIINGRKPFADEAVETRCLTYRPISTNRKDIPLQLPKRFHDEAAEIRNWALAFRLANLETMKVMDSHVEGLGPRSTQIILPLLSVVNMIEDTALREAYRGHIIGFALGSRDDRKSAKQESNDADVIRAYVDLSANGGPVTCGAIATEVCNDDTTPTRTADARSVARRLRNLGFKTKHERIGAVVSIEPERLRALKASYGVDDGDDSCDDAKTTVTRTAPVTM